MELLIPIVITLVVVVILGLMVLAVLARLVSRLSKNRGATEHSGLTSLNSPEPVARNWYSNESSVVDSRTAEYSASGFGGGGDYSGGGSGGSFDEPEAGAGIFETDGSATSYDVGAGGGDSGDGGGDSGSGGGE